MEKYTYALSENRIRHACRYHIVWCTTFRRPVLDGEITARVEELVKAVCKEKGITVLQLEVGPRMVYLYADMPPMQAVNNMVRAMKRRTSRIRNEYPRLKSRLPSLWTLHYFVSTEQEKPEKEIAAWLETQPRFARKEKKDGDGLGES